MAPKKKATTLSLSELQNILKEQTGTTTEGTSTKTTWAEDEFELPSAPLSMMDDDERSLAHQGDRGIGGNSIGDGSMSGRPNYSSDSSSRMGQGSLGGMGDRRDRRAQEIPTPTIIDQSRLPTRPPFSAFVGNIAFDTNESDLKSYFSGLRIKNINIPIGREDSRPRGFAYVDFEDLESLTKALLKCGPGFLLKGRYPRIDISEGKSSGSFTSSSSNSSFFPFGGNLSRSREGSRDNDYERRDSSLNSDWRKDAKPTVQRDESFSRSSQSQSQSQSQSSSPFDSSSSKRDGERGALSSLAGGERRDRERFGGENSRFSQERDKSGRGGSSSTAAFSGINSQNTDRFKNSSLSSSSSFASMVVNDGNWRETSKPISQDEIPKMEISSNSNSLHSTFQSQSSSSPLVPSSSNGTRLQETKGNENGKIGIKESTSSTFTSLGKMETNQEPKKPNLKAKLKPRSIPIDSTTVSSLAVTGSDNCDSLKNQDKLADLYAKKGKANPFGMAQPKNIINPIVTACNSNNSSDHSCPIDNQKNENENENKGEIITNIDKIKVKDKVVNDQSLEIKENHV